jgi:hypothetical protein
MASRHFILNNFIPILTLLLCMYTAIINQSWFSFKTFMNHSIVVGNIGLDDLILIQLWGFWVCKWSLSHLQLGISWLDMYIRILKNSLINLSLHAFLFPHTHPYTILFFPSQDDYRICMDFDIIQKDSLPICPVDASGCFTAEVTHFVGQYVKVCSL